MVIEFLSPYETCRSQVRYLQFIINFAAAVLCFYFSVVLLYFNFSDTNSSFQFYIKYVQFDIPHKTPNTKLSYILPLKSIINVHSCTLPVALYSMRCFNSLKSFRNVTLQEMSVL